MKLLYSFLILATIFLMACGGKSESASSESAAKAKSASSATSGSSSDAAAATNRKGKLVFKQYCIVCHGADGKLGISGAKDLSVSPITKEEAISQVTNGKGLMTPYKDILSKAQIESVVDYIQELKG